MLPTIATGNVASAIGGAYEVANSCRFNDADTAYMHKTNSGSASDGQKFTFSAWFKRGNNIGTSDDPTICGTNVDTSGNNFGYIVRITDDQLEFLRDYIGSSDQAHKKANHKLKDPHAWYHVVVAVDTTQGTAANRNRCYLNGTEITSFATDTNYDQNDTTAFNRDKLHLIGAKKNEDAVNNHYEGYLAEVCMIDGTQYAASDFGEFDSDSPTIWKPKDVSGLTFGNNGFYLDFEDSANLGNDANGGTDLTEVNLAATDQATDTPTNNFATFNPLIPQAELAYSEGNCIATDSGTGGNSRTALSTIAPGTGKWYAEFKLITDGGDYPNIGIWASDVAYVVTNNVGLPAHTWSYLNSSSGRVISGNSTVGSTSLGTYAEDDIIGIALDLDNDFLYFHKNGTYINSGDPTTGATGTGGYAVTAGRDYFFATTTNTNGAWGANFGGCPPFTISSGNADADGYGNFEYAVPSGYYALCTKNLAEYG